MRESIELGLTRLSIGVIGKQRWLVHGLSNHIFSSLVESMLTELYRQAYLAFSLLRLGLMELF